MNIAKTFVVITVGFLSLSPLVVPSQVRGQEIKSCVAAIVKAKERTREGRSINVFSDLRDHSTEYPDSAKKRPVTILMLMQGRETVSMMGSTRLKTSLASDIINACEFVSAVTFAQYQSGWSSTIGLMSDGSIKEFECLEPSRYGPKLRWGQEVCSV